MALTKEQAQEVKKKLIQQLETSLPADQFKGTKDYLDSLNPEEFEQFLIRNSIVKTDNDMSNDNVFRMIVEGKIKSYKIDENKEALAVLEINPLSKGHVLIIPKKHLTSIKELKKPIYSLAKKIEKKLKTIFNPRDIKIIPKEAFNHALIDIIPEYENQNVEKTTPEQLEELQRLLAKKRTKEKSQSTKGKKSKEEYKLPRRIP